MMDTIYKLEKQNERSKANQLKRIVFYLLISITMVQQMPIIRDVLYDQIRMGLYICFGIFSTYSVFQISIINNNIKLFIYLSSIIIYAVILYVVNEAFGYGHVNVFELLIPFGILLCSLYTDFNKEQLGKFLLWQILMSVLLGISSIFYYGEGFKITSRYFLRSKNQIGPLLGISAVITGVWIIDQKQFGLKDTSLIVRIGVFILLVLSLLVIRNRSGVVSVFITILFVLAKEYGIKRNIKNIVITQIIFLALIILFLLGAFDGIINAIYNSLFLNYDITDFNSISAGRILGYKSSLEFIKQYPVLGELETGKSISTTPHNYILNKWLNYGIIGSLPIVLFYLYLWFFTIKGIFISKKTLGFKLPVWVLLFSLIVSMFEYTYPYGPGASQIMVWFLLGQYYRFNFRNTRSASSGF